MKHFEVVVEAESPFGIARGLETVIRKLENEGANDGTLELPRMGITAAWRTVEKVSASDLEAGSLLGKAPEAPEKDPKDPGGVFVDTQKATEPPSAPPPLNLPDISMMDVEEARSTVGVAANLEELAAMEEAEIQSSRFPGGRKGVLQYIAKMRNDLKKTSGEPSETDVRFGTVRGRQ